MKHAFVLSLGILVCDVLLTIVGYSFGKKSCEKDLKVYKNYYQKAEAFITDLDNTLYWCDAYDSEILDDYIDALRRVEELN